MFKFWLIVINLGLAFGGSISTGEIYKSVVKSDSEKKIQSDKKSDDAQDESEYFKLEANLYADTFKKNDDGNWVFGEKVYFKKGTIVYGHFTDSLVKNIIINNGRDASGEINEILFIPATRDRKEPKAKPGFNINRFLGLKPKNFNYSMLRSPPKPVYYDAPAGQTTVLTSVPHIGKLDCKANKDLCIGFPTTQDPLRILETRPQSVLDPITSEFVPEVFYKVCMDPKVPEDGTCPEASTGWIDADKVGATKRPVPPDGASPYIPNYIQFDKGPRLPDDKPAIKTTEQPMCQDNLVQFVEKTLGPIEEAKRDALSKVGQCWGADYVEEYNKINADLLAKAKRKGRWTSDLNSEKRRRVAALGQRLIRSTGKTAFDLYMEPNLGLRPPAKVVKQSISNDKLNSIDILARSIYAEMRSCSHQTDAYYKGIARVLLNRAAYVKHEGRTLPFVKGNFEYEKKSIDELIIDVASASAQLSSYNSNDINLRYALCPLTSDTTIDEFNLWLKALDIAWEARTQTAKFLQETKGITELDYTSDFEEGWTKTRKKKVQFTVNGVTQGKKKCLILYGDEDPIKFHKEYPNKELPPKKQPLIHELQKNPQYFSRNDFLPIDSIKK